MKYIILFIVDLLVKLHILNPIRVAKLKFFYKCHKWPNFKHPKDVNEKINWMKFYGDTSQWSMYADKYAVRQHVEKLGLGDTLIPLVGRWDNVDEIDWDKLPSQFVLKCNNGSGDVVICKDKRLLDIGATKKHFQRQLREKLSVLSGEPHYASIKPCIIAEELLDMAQPCKSTSLIDYKIWVFDGKPMFIWCTYNRHKYYAEVALYDMDWQFHPEWSVFTNHYIKPDTKVPKPKCFDYMMEVASKLGKGNPIARIDLYIVNDKVYFGEMTMTSQGGYMDFFTQEFLDKMGELTILPLDENRS
jgi:hypothetical protein